MVRMNNHINFNRWCYFSVFFHLNQSMRQYLIGPICLFRPLHGFEISSDIS